MTQVLFKRPQWRFRASGGFGSFKEVSKSQPLFRPQAVTGALMLCFLDIVTKKTLNTPKKMIWYCDTKHLEKTWKTAQDFDFLFFSSQRNTITHSPLHLVSCLRLVGNLLMQMPRGSRSQWPWCLGAAGDTCRAAAFLTSCLLLWRLGSWCFLPRFSAQQIFLDCFGFEAWNLTPQLSG